jgi:O-antigen/teichoic acid export membrane protein
MTINFSSRLAYIGANSAAYVLNFFSGLILARGLGPEGRGDFAFFSSLFLITLLLAPINSRNASSIASMKEQSWSKIDSKFPFKKIYIYVVAITLTCTLTFFFILSGEFEIKTLVFFSASNLACGLVFYINFAEGIFRVEERLFELAMLRFLGLAVPSLYVFILFFLGTLKLELVLLSQFFAVISCFLFLKYRVLVEPKFSYTTYSIQVKKTYFSYLLEYIANILILLSVTFTADAQSIGHFAVAMSLILISETFYPLVESRMLNRIHKTYSNKKSVSLGPLATALKELFASQFVFIPLAFVIPIVYGTAYSESVTFAIILILARFLFAAVKLFNCYAVLLNRYDTPILLYSIYIFLYISNFLFFNQYSHEFSWQISSILASLGVALLGFFLIRKLKVDNSLRMLNKEIAGTTNDKFWSQ